MQAIEGSVRTTFTNRGFSSTVKSTPFEDTSQGQLNSIALLAESVSDLQIARQNPTGFDSIKELEGVDYIGYIIEKERLNRNTNEWLRIDEYRLIGVAASSFTDTRVAYGEIYRYRIKSVIRVTKKITTIEEKPVAFSQSPTKLLQEKLSEAIKNQKDLIEYSIKNASTIQSKEILLFENFYLSVSSGKAMIFQKSPQKLAVPVSQNAKITDISILNNKVDVFGYEGFYNIKNTIEKVKYISYYYESLPSRNWKYVEIFENIPPPPPESIGIQPNTLAKKIIITWLKPSSSQRDIQKYFIYRRDGLGKPWSKISEVGEIDINSDGIPDAQVSLSNGANVFEDKIVEFGKKYIYAISCLDIHGIESFLSVQIQAQLNEKFKQEKEERRVKWISGSGATILELNAVFKKFLDRKETIIAKKTIKLKPSIKLNGEKTFLIKVRSLDTHEIKEITYTVKNTPAAKLIERKSNPFGSRSK